ncbi:MAG: FtsQ-type POTRA domain-containing protein [Acidobacteria bacterium]|nr:FtsQ-type POTRA domain-containing protein [Acidobacteriota bacterium]
MTPAQRRQLEDLADEAPARYLRAERKPEVRRRALWRRLLRWRPRLFLALAVVAVVGGVGYVSYGYAVSASWFRLPSKEAVELENLQFASPGVLREHFVEDAGRSVFTIPLEERRLALEGTAWVEHARVQRVWPNRLRVVIEERIPVAFLRQGKDLLLVDAAGVVLERPAGATFTFPVLTGFPPGLTRAQKKERVALYLEFLRDLDAGEEAQSTDISEVDLSDPDNLRATVIERGKAVVLYFGRDRWREKYEAYLEHRSLWQKSGEPVHTVDLRYRGQLVLNPSVTTNPHGRGR